MARLLIFDFDGTIADTKAVYYKVIGQELEAFGFSKEDTEKAIDLGMSLKKTLENLGLGFISRWFLRKRIMREVIKQCDRIKKCKDADAIKSVKERKVLVTNSLKEFVMPILKHFKLKKEFFEVYGADDFYDKAKFIEDYLRENKINKKDCFYIGDRVADIKLARKIGCGIIIVSGKCAWNSRAELLKESPDFILNDLADLNKIFA